MVNTRRIIVDDEVYEITGVRVSGGKLKTTTTAAGLARLLKAVKAALKEKDDE